MDLRLTQRGNKHVVEFMDMFTKWPIVYPVPDQQAEHIFHDSFNKHMLWKWLTSGMATYQPYSRPTATPPMTQLERSHHFCCLGGIASHLLGCTACCLLTLLYPPALRTTGRNSFWLSSAREAVLQNIHKAQKQYKASYDRKSDGCWLPEWWLGIDLLPKWMDWLFTQRGTHPTKSYQAMLLMLQLQKCTFHERTPSKYTRCGSSHVSRGFRPGFTGIGIRAKNWVVHLGGWSECWLSWPQLLWKYPQLSQTSHLLQPPNFSDKRSVSPSQEESTWRLPAPIFTEVHQEIITVFDVTSLGASSLRGGANIIQWNINFCVPKNSVY